ncbi:MAG: cytidylate kinase-like family protein [Planctomycetaceae bacterium]|nr:cytidylate kinase-like family protein [Planctomycetaceae bacterium]
MAKISLSEHMNSSAVEGDEAANAGPFITISRQAGCYGFSLGLLLMEILNENLSPSERTWKIYHREILSRLATETNVAEEFLEKQRRSKPGFLEGLFRSLSKDQTPSGQAIRNRITTIIRGLAIEGHAILIGQGASGATQDLANGLSVRVEAPENWRVKQVAFREGLGETQARLRIRAMEEEREYLRRMYETSGAQQPCFNLTYDCSVFTLAQIAQQIVYAMKLLKII